MSEEEPKVGENERLAPLEREVRRCRTCQHWERREGDFDIRYHGTHSGLCSSDKFIEKGDDKVPIDGLQYWDYEGYSAGFETGEDFGCVHWTPRA